MTKKRWFWPTVVTAAGVLGLQNGIWQYVTQPVATWVRDVILNVITLGVDSYKDSIYLDAARGYHEHSAQTIVVFILFFLGVIPGTVHVGLLRELRFMRRTAALGINQRTPLFVRMFDKVFGDPRTDPEKAYKRFRAAGYALLTIVVFFTATLAAVLATSSYASSAVAYYNQLRAIVGPHVAPQRLLELDQQFATVQTRDDYLILMTYLDTEARKYSSKVPEFNVW